MLIAPTPRLPLTPTMMMNAEKTEQPFQSYHVLASGPSMFPQVYQTSTEQYSVPAYTTLNGMQVQHIAPLQYDMEPSYMTLEAASRDDELVDKSMSALFEPFCSGSTMTDSTTAHLPQMTTNTHSHVPGVPQMATMDGPGSCPPEGTMMVTTTVPSPGLPQMAAVNRPSSGLPQGTKMVNMHLPQMVNVSSLPQKAKSRQKPVMDYERIRELRLEKNKGHAKISRERKKAYEKSLESRVNALEADKKQLQERLQYLELFCRARGISP